MNSTLVPKPVESVQQGMLFRVSDRADCLLTQSRALTLLALLFVITPQSVRGQKANEMAGLTYVLRVANQGGIKYPMSFSVFSDPHLGCSVEGDPNSDCSCYTSFQNVLANIAATEMKPLFVVCCGDITDKSDDGQYEDYKNKVNGWMGVTGIPLFSIPGNHDFYGGAFDHNHGHADYEDHIHTIPDGYESLDYYVDYGNLRFVFVDNVQKEDNYCWEEHVAITPEQLTTLESWFANTLSKFVFAHIASPSNYSYTTSSESQDCSGITYNIPGYEDFDNMMQSYRVAAAFYGHRHNYDYLTRNCPVESFKVPVACKRLASRGWLEVSVYGKDANVNGYSVVLHQRDESADIWNQTCKFASKSVWLVDMNLTESWKVVGENITAGSPTEPVVIEGPAVVEMVASNHIRLDGRFIVRNGGRLTARIATVCSEVPCESQP